NHFDVGHPPGHEYEIPRPLAHDLVGDVDLAALRIPRLRPAAHTHMLLPPLGLCARPAPDQPRTEPLRRYPTRDTLSAFWALTGSGAREGLTARRTASPISRMGTSVAGSLTDCSEELAALVEHGATGSPGPLAAAPSGSSVRSGASVWIMFSFLANDTCAAPWPGTSSTIIRRTRTSRSTRTPPTSDPSSSPRRARSCRFPKSAVYTIATSAGQRSPPPPLLAPPNVAPQVRSACPLTPHATRIPPDRAAPTAGKCRPSPTTSDEPQSLGPVNRSRMLLSDSNEVSAKDRMRFWRRTGSGARAPAHHSR